MQSLFGCANSVRVFTYDRVPHFAIPDVVSERTACTNHHASICWTECMPSERTCCPFHACKALIARLRGRFWSCCSHPPAIVKARTSNERREKHARRAAELRISLPLAVQGRQLPNIYMYTRLLGSPPGAVHASKKVDQIRTWAHRPEESLRSIVAGRRECELANRTRSARRACP